MQLRAREGVQRNSSPQAELFPGIVTKNKLNIRMTQNTEILRHTKPPSPFSTLGLHFLGYRPTIPLPRSLPCTSRVPIHHSTR